VVGLDLGQAADYTALAIGEIRPEWRRVAIPENAALGLRREVTHQRSFALAVRHLQRFPLRTPYPDQVAGVASVVARTRELGPTLLVVDHTGVGRAVVDLVRAAGLAVPLWPVTIATSAMGQARRDAATGEWTVPKKDLVGALISLAHGGRLAVADRLPEARLLQEELRTFRMKITAAANLSFEAWREGQHDDLVLAVALACWAAQRWAVPGGLI
jgi:hypothetical protein